MDIDTTGFNTETNHVTAIRNGMFFASRHIADMFLAVWPAMLPNVIIWAITGWCASQFTAQFHFDAMMGGNQHILLHSVGFLLLVLWLLATAIFWGSQTYVLLYYTQNAKWPHYHSVIQDYKTFCSFILRATICLSMVVVLGLFPSLLLWITVHLKWYWLLSCWIASNLLLVIPLLPVYYEWVIKGNSFREAFKQIKTGCSRWGTWFTVSISGFSVISVLSAIFWLPTFMSIYVFHLNQMELLLGDTPDLPVWMGYIIPVLCGLSTLASLSLGGLLSVPLSILYGLKIKEDN